MEYNLSFDYVALVICLSMVLKCLYRKSLREESERLFLVIASMCGLTIVMDIASISTSLGRNKVFIANSMYVILRCIEAFLYFVYVCYMTDTVYTTFCNKRRIILSMLPTFLVFACVVSNYFNHAMFIIDEAANYHRGPLLVIECISAFIYFIAAVVLLVKNYKLLALDKILATISIIPFTLIALLIQGIYPNLLVETIFTAFSLLIMSITVDRTEEQLDVVTGFSKKEVFALDVQRTFGSKHEFTILLINIKNYSTIKSVGGDEAAVTVNKVLSNAIEMIDSKMKLHARFAYLRNGIFSVKLTNKSREMAKDFASELLEKVELLKEEDNMRFAPIINICIAECPQDISTSTMLIDFSESFRNVIDFEKSHIVALSELSNRSHTHLLLEIDHVIDRALQQKNFEVYYQPIYDIKENRFKSAEALLRLRDEKYGLVSPNIFIPAAEQSGAIVPIGEFVVESVCEFIVSDRFKELGLEYIEVNLSILQCMEPTLAERMIEIMERYQVPAERINIEITESAITYDEEVLSRNINKLKAHGVSLSLDDYGTGYSNIRRMATVPFDIIKLDKIFVQERNDPKMKVIIEDTIKMVKNLNLSVLVEGIEEKSDLEFFKTLGCDYIQGYYYSKPVPVDEFISFIDSNIVKDE